MCCILDRWQNVSIIIFNETLLWQLFRISCVAAPPPPRKLFFLSKLDSISLEAVHFKLNEHDLLENTYPDVLYVVIFYSKKFFWAFPLYNPSCGNSATFAVIKAYLGIKNSLGFSQLVCRYTHFFTVTASKIRTTGCITQFAVRQKR
jgi:hypothetical protein